MTSRQTLNPLFILFALLFANAAMANERYHYNADVKGMVCAFCAYNVSKRVSSLPGVIADSVNVDLRGGQVSFDAEQAIDPKQLTAIFADSGFTLSNLRQSAATRSTHASLTNPALSLHTTRDQLDRFGDVFESLGEIAADAPLRIVLRAAPDVEDSLLKPLLMGRQQVIKTRFIPQAGEQIRIEIFAEQ